MSSNYTIDDSQWSTPSLTLSPGWNILNTTSSYFISAAQVDQVRPLLLDFHGGSYSWNTHAGCSNTITFVGTSITAYGLAGPDSGEYSAVLDGDGRLMSSQQAELDWDHVLYTVQGLDEGEHTLTFTNLVEGNWFGFDYAAISSVPTVHSEASSTPTSFTLPEGILIPAHLLLADQPTPSQLALITTYKPHWTTGAYFVVFIAGVSLACLYVFFLFQFAGMLRDRAGEDSLPVVDMRIKRPKLKEQEPGWNKRFSWAAGLEGMDQERGDGDGESESGSGSVKGKEKEREKDRPSDKVVHALKLKQISGPSPVPGFKEEVAMKEFKQLSINTSCSEGSGSGSGSGSIGRSFNSEEVGRYNGEGSGSASGSGEGEGEDEDEEGTDQFKEDLERKNKRASTQSQNGTWPRRPGSFPRLSFSASSPNSPRSPRITPGPTTPRTPGGRSMKGYF